jgi:hypothetical protein
MATSTIHVIQINFRWAKIILLTSLRKTVFTETDVLFLNLWKLTVQLKWRWQLEENRFCFTLQNSKQVRKTLLFFKSRHPIRWQIRISFRKSLQLILPYSHEHLESSSYKPRLILNTILLTKSNWCSESTWERKGAIAGQTNFFRTFGESNETAFRKRFCDDYMYREKEGW